MFEQWKNRIFKIVKSRVFVLTLILLLLFGTLIRKVFVLQIIHGQEYMDEYALQIKKTKTFRGKRGNIYDVNGNLLAYSKISYSVTIEDVGVYKNREEKNKMLNAIILKVIYLVETNNDSVSISDFGVEVSDDGYKYRDTGTQKLRFLADVFGYTTIDMLSSEQKSISAADLIHYMCTDEVYGYGIDEESMDASTVLKLVTLRYKMNLNSYQKYIETPIAEDVSEETLAAIKENKADLTGVDIGEEYVRHYEDALYFSPLIGYTGDISREEYEERVEEGLDYERTDVIGKSGVERSLDEYLQGGKGQINLFVDNTGKILSSEQTKEATAGNDVYLTIDRDLQIATYKMIEEKLAGILYGRLADTLTFDRSSVEDTYALKTPVGDVYFAFFDNELLDMDHMWSTRAKTNEKAVAAVTDEAAQKKMAEMLKIMKDPAAKPFADLSPENQTFMSCIVDDILTNYAGILVRSDIDKSDDMVKAWVKDETVNVYDYLNYVISQGWVDMTPLQQYIEKKSGYSDASQIYNAILAYLEKNGASNHEFRKTVMKYQIREGNITGKQACMILYEQGVLETSDGMYASLANDSISPYEFVSQEIQTLALTPGQIGIEPCSASAVVTEVGSGKVLACVSYPGYDNNRLSNIMDNQYFRRLSSMRSSPIYNKATQERTAPGSTFKMLSAVAGLTEGAIETDTIIHCYGEFKEVEPPIRCWVYPNGHGELDVVEAINHSCNFFFNQVGYNLGLKSDGAYSSDLGISKLRKYAKAFGFGEESGIELVDSSPKISDTASVPSAMGQGTNNYTTTQLCKYVSTVASSGERYDLSLLDHVDDDKGKTIKSFKAKAANDLKDVSQEHWDAVHEGMHKVGTETGPFLPMKDLNFEMAGKTGTAQQSRVHPDHALFVGYAPYKNPEIAIAIRIANGYSSVYAAELGRDIVRYKYQLSSEKALIHGAAAPVSNQSGRTD